MSGGVACRLRFLALAAATLALAGCGGVLDPQGPVGAGNRSVLLNSLFVMLVIVVPTILALLFFAWWFRAGNARARYRPHFTYSGRIELVVWSVPLLTILFLGGLIFYGSIQQDPRRPLSSDQPPLEVQVVALDWKWLFIYPYQRVATVNRLVMPAGRPVLFRITSSSVMNSFFVPQLGSMIYAMNGMETQLNLQADKPGDLYGVSAHFSGDGFADMNFDVKVLPPDQFDDWARRLGRGDRLLDTEAYRQLVQQSSDLPPLVYSGVQQGLFASIVKRELKPGPGPQTGPEGHPEVHPAARSQRPPLGATPSPQPAQQGG